MATPWCRLWSDMPNDPKWRTIAKVSGRHIPEVIAVYIHMMVCASNATERGRTQGWCNEDVANALDMETNDVESIVTAMQGRVLEDGHLTGWAKRQPAREDGAAERAKQWRNKKKEETNANERKRTEVNAEERPEVEVEVDTEIEVETDTEKKLAAAFEKKRPFIITNYPSVNADLEKMTLLDKYRDKPVMDPHVLVNNWIARFPKEKPSHHNEKLPSGRPNYLAGVKC